MQPCWHKGLMRGRGCFSLKAAGTRREAHDAGIAPPVVLEATHEKALKYIPLETLKKYQKP
jgi:uncharacterized protein (DUF2237 family)